MTKWILACILGWSLMGLSACSQIKVAETVTSSRADFPNQPMGLPEGITHFNYVSDNHIFSDREELRDFCEQLTGTRSVDACRKGKNKIEIIGRMVNHAYGCEHEETHVIWPWSHDK